MSVRSVLAEVEALAQRLGEAEPAEVEGVLAAVRAAALSAERSELAELTIAIGRLEAAAARELDELERALRHAGAAREAVAAYGGAVRSFTRGQRVTTSV